MKKNIAVLSLMAATVTAGSAQTAISAYSVAQPDLKGTARYMGMAGAFGALGGDLSAISQNPGGIGVYRSGDVGFTLDLDLQNSHTEDFGTKYKMDQTKFLLNNIGAVLTLKLPSKTLPNLNFGFTYNKGSSFNRVYGGGLNNLRNSMSNYIADTSILNGVLSGDVSDADGINPYDVGYDYYQAPWMNILAARTNVLSYKDIPYTGADGKPAYTTQWYGLWQDSMTGKDTSGFADYAMQEKGGVDEFNIVLGGNIANKLYWGMNFQITNMNYQLSTFYSENLKNAYRLNNNKPVVEDAYWDYSGAYSLSGTGFSYQLGLIFKPVQALRLGFSFHTPTWYGINEQYIGSMYYEGYSGVKSETTNFGVPGATSYNFRTPWKILASAAGVLGNNLIVSFDYEWANYGKMHFSEPNYYDYYDYYDPWWGMSSTRSSLIDWNNPYANENLDISTYYKSTNTFRVGLEFKPISALSIRAGYSYVSSPVKKEAQENRVAIVTSNLFPSYRLDNKTNYVTFGLGYRYSHIYVDLAYVFKTMSSEYHAYSSLLYVPDKMRDLVSYPDGSQNIGGYTYKNTAAPHSKISFTDNQIVLSAGYRF